LLALNAIGTAHYLFAGFDQLVIYAILGFVLLLFRKTGLDEEKVLGC
jgi:uncharacterized membrane protein YeiB